ncbi:MAG: UbiA family prenyltransferase [Candidatus Diapherotrites archaeon]|nr:UbiA family prenyltransferase [Candidatus Diapherotrites archaeon]
MNAWLELMRPMNGLMAAFAVVLGFFIATGTVTENAFIAAAAALLISSAGMALNDYYDLPIDKKRKKHRPLPSKRIKPWQAFAASIALFAAGIAACFAVNVLCGIIGSFTALLLALYAIDLSKKPLVGNAIVAWSTGLTIVFGEAASGTLASPIIIVLFAMAFFSTMGRELYKSIEDMKEDKGVRKTLPLILGSNMTLAVAAVFVLLAIIMSPLPYWLGFGIPYLAAVAVVDAYFALIVSKSFKKEYAFCAKHMKLAQALALAAFAAGTLWGV